MKNKKFKYFLVVLGSLTFLLNGCIKEVDRPFDASLKERLAYIPENVSYVGYFNLSRVYETKHFNFVSNLMFTDIKRDFKAIQRYCNFNYKRDIDDFIFSEDLKTYKRYYIITGNFNKISPDVEAQLEKRNLYLYKISSKQLLFTNDTTLIEKIENELEYPNCAEENLFMMISQSVYFKNHFWIAASKNSINNLVAEKGSSEEYKFLNLLTQLDFIGLSVDVKRDVDLNITFICNQFISANLLQSILRGAFAVYKVTNPNDVFVNEFSRIQYTENNNRLYLKLHFTEDTIEKFKKSELKNKLKINFEK